MGDLPCGGQFSQGSNPDLALRTTLIEPNREALLSSTLLGLGLHQLIVPYSPAPDDANDGRD